MAERTIEAMLVSPPERNELVVHLFHVDGGQWGEVFRDGGRYWIELFSGSNQNMLRFPAQEMINALTNSVNQLRTRLEGEQ